MGCSQSEEPVGTWGVQSWKDSWRSEDRDTLKQKGWRMHGVGGAVLGRAGK